MSFVIGAVLWGFGVVCGVLLAAALVAWWVLQHADVELDGPRGVIARWPDTADGAGRRSMKPTEFH